jgi:hypothetical protein
MAEKYHDQEFVDYVVKNLVEKPEDVVVTRTVDEMGVLLSLTVDKEDMGVVIGKEGRTAKALRTLLRVLGAKSDSRINLKIVDPEGSEPRSERTESSSTEATQDKEVSEESSEATSEVVEAEPAIEEVTEVAEEAEPVAEEAPEVSEATSDVDDDDDRPMADLEI